MDYQRNNVTVTPPLNSRGCCCCVVTPVIIVYIYIVYIYCNFLAKLPKSYLETRKVETGNRCYRRCYRGVTGQALHVPLRNRCYRCYVTGVTGGAR